MPTIAQKLFKNEILHSVYLKRHEISVANKIEKFLRDNQVEILEELRQKDIFTEVPTRRNRSQLIIVLKRTQKQIQKLNKKVIEEVRQDMIETAKYEVRFQKRMTRESFKPIPVQLKLSPDDAILQTALYTEPFLGDIFKTWSKDFSLAQQKRITRETRLAFFQGEGQEGLTRRLLSRGVFKKTGALAPNIRQARAFARTSLNHSINQARDLFHKQNNYAKKFRYTAVLDGRTTLLCASRDGVIFKEGNRPGVPAHIQCRSIYVPIIDPDLVFGDRQTITSTSTRKKLRSEWRASARQVAGKKWNTYNKTTQKNLVNKQKSRWLKQNVGTVSAKTNFNDFLKNQSAKFQDEYLGKERSALFRKGGLDLNKFIDKKTGRTITLDILKRSEKKAFSLAGL